MTKLVKEYPVYNTMSNTIKKIQINSCPTGGWVMNNRKRVENEIRKKHPEADIVHNCGYPFTIMVSSDGVKGKRHCAFPLFCCPSFVTFFPVDDYSKEEYVPTGVPQATIMSR